MLGVDDKGELVEDVMDKFIVVEMGPKQIVYKHDRSALTQNTQNFQQGFVAGRFICVRRVGDCSREYQQQRGQIRRYPSAATPLVHRRLDPFLERHTLTLRPA